MDQNLEHFRKLQTLAAQWRGFALFLVFFARRTLHLATSDPRRALVQAAQVEVYACTALAALTQELSALNAHDHPSPAEAAALAHLRAIAVGLLTLAVFIQSVMQRLSAGLRGHDIFAGARVTRALPAVFSASPCQSLGFIDTG